MIYDTVIFLLTNQCNLECMHCIMGCSPKKKSLLDEKLIQKVVSDLKYNSKIKMIGISGGEAFLYPDMVKKIIQIITSAGKNSSIYTNGFWCTDYEVTYETLYELKQNGLNLLLTSVDTYHQKDIPIENIKYLLDVCQELTIPVKVHVSSTYTNAESNDKILAALGLSKLSASITTSAVLPVGRAASNIAEEDIISTQKFSKLQCHYDGMCCVDWEGNVLWCCTLKNKNMIIGNIRKDNINSILTNFRKNKVFMCILNKGLSYLISVIKQYNLMPIKDTYASGCEVCNTIFSNDEVLEQLEKIL